MSDDVRIVISDRVMEITFDRIAKKNALTQAMYAAAAAGFEQASRDDDIHCVLITGGDEVFTAGNDVDDFTAAPAETSDRQSGDIMRAILDFPKPVVAAVSGYAVGIGTTMLLHMDLVYADETAIFRTPFVDLGLTPEFASTQTLPRLAGYQRAAEMLLLNAKIDAPAALAMGLVNAVLPAGQCLAHAPWGGARPGRQATIGATRHQGFDANPSGIRFGPYEPGKQSVRDPPEKPRTEGSSRGLPGKASAGLLALLAVFHHDQAVGGEGAVGGAQDGVGVGLGDEIAEFMGQHREPGQGRRRRVNTRGRLAAQAIEHLASAQAVDQTPGLGFRERRHGHFAVLEQLDQHAAGGDHDQGAELFVRDDTEAQLRGGFYHARDHGPGAKPLVEIAVGGQGRDLATEAEIDAAHVGLVVDARLGGLQHNRIADGRQRIAEFRFAAYHPIIGNGDSEISEQGQAFGLVEIGAGGEARPP